MLRAVVLVLAVVVLAEGLLMMRLEHRVHRVVERAERVTALSELGLLDRPGRLMLLSGEDLGYSLDQQRRLQRDCQAWLDGWVDERGLDPDLGEMLAGVLSSHISAYGDFRIQSALGGLRAGEGQRFEASLQQRLHRTVQLLVGKEQARAFREAFEPAWQGWVAGS